MLIKGGHLFESGRPLEVADILVEQGRIVQVGADLHADLAGDDRSAILMIDNELGK